MNPVLTLCLTALASQAFAGATPMPLTRAHAHNDYEHERPLLDALDHGFCSIEADIHLVDGKLLVAHDLADIRPERTLEALYLDPLRERVKAHGGRVYPGGPEVTLLIDFKTAAEPTYAALDAVLRQYADMLSTFEKGEKNEGAVLVIVSGNRPTKIMAGQKVRYAAVDGRLPDLKGDAPKTLIPWISASWGDAFQWNGEGDMPADQRAKLDDIVAKAHATGRRVRFWAVPGPAAWPVLHDAGVDLLNADDLPALQQFLLEREAKGKE